MITYNPKLKTVARNLRNQLTDSERVLWQRLRRRQLLGVRFLRQKPLGSFIVDFYAPARRLVVEVDGGQHFEPDGIAKDEYRDGFLQGLGLRVLRFSNRQVLEETDGVIEDICQVIVGISEQPKSPRTPL